MKKFILILLIINLFNIYSQSDDQIDDVFGMSLEELLNVKVITAGKELQKISDIPASVTVITKSDIDKLGYGSIKEILQHINGFYMIEDGYWLGSTNFGVRGFFKNGPFSNVVVLVNGVSQLSDKYSDYPDVKITVPVNAIERIEVIKGPMSVIYGNGAFFGAINIITTSDDIKNNTAEIVVEGGNYNKNFNAKYSGNISDIRYSVITSYLNDSGLDRKYTDLTTNENIIEYVGLDKNATTKDHLEYISKYFGINLQYNDLIFDFSYNLSDKGVFDGTPTYGNGNRLKTNATNFNLKYSYDISENLKAKVSGGYYNHSHILNYSLFRDYYYEIDYQQTNAFDMDINLFWNYKSVDILAGYYYRKTTDILQLSDFAYYGLDYGDGKSGLPEDEAINSHSLYGQITYNPTNNISLIAGFRVEHLDDYKMYYARGVVSEDSSDGRLPTDPSNRRVIESIYHPEDNGFSYVPRIAAIFKINKSNVIKLLYGESRLHPSFTENYRQIAQNRPELRSSVIRTVEANYLSELTDKFSINTSIFWNKLEGLIRATNIFNQTTGEWELYSKNSGKMKTLGFEISFNYQPVYQLKFDFDMTYQKTKNNNEGWNDIEVAYSPEILGYANIQYLITNDISIALIGRYVGKMQTNWATDNLPENGSRIAPPSNEYYVLDANFRYNNCLVEGVYANIKMYNITDKEIRYPTTNSNEWINKGFIDYGFRFLVSLGYEF